MRDAEEGKRRPFRRIRGTREEANEDPILNKLDILLKTQEENFKSWREGLEKRLNNLEASTANLSPTPLFVSSKEAKQTPPQTIRNQVQMNRNSITHVSEI